jgi:hypothetical protein
MNLIENLRELEEYNEVDNVNPPHDLEQMEFQNIIHSDSNTVLTVTATSYEEDTLVSATFYFEIDGQGHWFETYVDTVEGLHRFKRDSERLMVDMINRYES